ncbi:MAG: YHYH protein [Pseudomonadota bacterium]
MFRIPFAVSALGILLGAGLAFAASNRVDISDRGDTRCLSSNGVPNHAIGSFPNSGNPHSFAQQDLQLCVPLSPAKGASPQKVENVGMALNGILIRPGTADWNDGSSRRGHSRNRSSGWNLDGMGPDNTLGLDANNAHVDKRGLYHYHGVPDAEPEISQGSLFGYAADGFEIHYIGDAAQPSYQLKSGTRPTAPFGAYDGTYNQDFEFIQGLGNLDECNGTTTSSGKYVYFATDAYPFYPRCLWGTEIARLRG